MLAGANVGDCPKNCPIQLLSNDRDDCFPNFAKLSPCDLRTKLRCSHCLTGVDNTPLVKVFERGLGKTFCKKFSPKTAPFFQKVS